MPEIEDFQTDASRNGDETQSEAARRLSLLSPWHWPLTFGPFVLLIALSHFQISNAIPKGLFVGSIILTTGWAVAFKGYLLYLNYQK